MGRDFRGSYQIHQQMITKGYRSVVLTATLLSVAAIGHAQLQGDSILAHERSIDRPLTVHRSQLRMGVAYGFLVNSVRFDDDRNRVDLSNEGLTSVGHAIFLEVNYGFFEFLQASVRIDHIQQGLRSRSAAVIASPEDPLNIIRITERRGWSDLDLTLDFKVPFYTRGYDLVVTAGRSLPVSPHEPDQPDHKIESQSGFENITYRFFERAGSGVPAWLLGIQGKFRGNRLAFSFMSGFRAYTGGGESVVWSARLDQRDITYGSRPYAYQLGDEMDLHFIFEYQALSFFNLFTGYSLEKVMEGWSEATSRRVLVPEQSLNTLLFGAEVLATPRLWIRQEARLPVSGQNRLAPFMLSTRVIYNLFPFQ